MDLGHELHGHGTVGADILYQKKASFLNKEMFTGMTLLFFAFWIWISARLRKASFTQDSDGDAKWTYMNRKTAAFGIPFSALFLSFAAIYWMKSLEYHWFSTMYGVWFFANCMRAAMAFGVVITWWLYTRGDYKGIFNTNQQHCLVALAYAFVEYSSPEELSKKEIPENYYLETKINDAGQPWVYLFLNATLLKSGYATLNLAEKDNIKYNALFQSLIEDAKVAQRGFFSQIYLDQIRGASQQSDDDSEPIDP